MAATLALLPISQIKRKTAGQLIPIVRTLAQRPIITLVQQAAAELTREMIIARKALLV
jgi:hypothetical protein